MNRFTFYSIKKPKMSGILGVFAWVAFLFSTTLTQAQSSTSHCAAPAIMTGSATGSVSGLCLFCSVSNPNGAADNSLSTGASFNLAIGIGNSGTVDVRGATVYPAGSTVTAVIDNGGSGLLSNLIGGLLTSSTIELTMNGVTVQTIDASNGLIQVDLLGGLLGSNQGAIGGLATVDFNGAKFTYGSFVSLLSGWTMNGIAVSKGCASFQSCGSAVSSQTAFFANGNSQTGTLTLPLNVSATGGTKISISGNGFTSPVSNYTLASGQTSVTIPVTFNGSGAGGSRTVTVTQHDFITGTALSTTCTYLVNVQASFSVTNGGPIGKTSGGVGTTTTGNAVSDLTPTGGVNPYVYTAVDCSSGASTSSNATTSTLTTAHGSVTVNKTTGAYTYTPNASFGAAGDQFCIKVCDSATPTAACETITYTITLVNATYTFSCSSGALTMPSGVFTANGVAGQTGTIRIPLSGVTAGAASFTLSSSTAGIMSTNTPYLATLTAGQSYVDIPVTYNGSGVAGTRTITVTSPAANTSSTCNTGTVTIGAPFALGNGNPTVSTNTNTPYNSSASTTLAALSPTGGTAPYVYSSVNCTTDLASTASAQGGVVSINTNTGAYTYTPAAGFTGTDTYCIKVCDSSVPASCHTATYTATVGTPVGTVSTVNCNSGSAGAATANQPYSGSNTVNYTGGNSGAYAAQTVNSTGVSGLTATLAAGNFTSGAGSVTYSISGTPSAQGTATFNITLGGQSCSFAVTVNSGVVNPPTISANPNPPVAGQSVTLTASGCAGTVTWFNNGTQVGTGTPFTTTAVAGANYTATCTVNGTASNPSTPITVPAAAIADLAVAFTSNPGSSFASGQSRQYVVTVRNLSTTSTSAATTLSISSIVSGFSVTGGGSQNIGALAPGGQQTFNVTLLANSKGASGALGALIPSSADNNSGNNSASIYVSIQNP